MKTARELCEEYLVLDEDYVNAGYIEDDKKYQRVIEKIKHRQLEIMELLVLMVVEADKKGERFALEDPCRNVSLNIVIGDRFVIQVAMEFCMDDEEDNEMEYILYIRSIVEVNNNISIN